MYFRYKSYTLADLGRYALPSHVKRGHGGPLLAKLESLLKGWKRDGTGEFVTMQRYVNNLSDGIK